MEPLIYRERRPPADPLASANRQLVIDIDDVHTLAQGIVDTIRDPLLVLDQDLRVVSANRAFCQTFRMTRQNIEDRAVYALGDGQWNIPALRFLLENIAPHHTVMEGYEVEREFPGIGRRSMLLNAREVVSQRNARKLILLTIEDVTERRAAEREMAELLRQKEMLYQEMQHRIANSLQALAVSMTDDNRPISLEVQAESGGTASSAEAVSIGLVVAELVINAFKHAFVSGEAAGLVVVAYEAAETSWRLTVSDNGIGTPEGQLDSDKPRPGLGTIIVEALAKQLDARVEVMRSRRGTTVSITHGTPDRAWLPLTGAGTGLQRKSNGDSVAAA
jgi:chemotaxis protein methyltransferase CheR